MERQLRAIEILPGAETAVLLEYDADSDGGGPDLDVDEARAAAE